MRPTLSHSRRNAMSRLTAAVEAEFALIRRAIHDATHNRITSKIAAVSSAFKRILRPSGPPRQAPRRNRGTYAWDARGNLVPLQKGGATHSGRYEIISPAPGTQGSETSRQQKRRA